MKTTTRQKLSIESVRIEHETDIDPDTSHLGEYTDDYTKAIDNDFAIIRTGDKAGEFLQDGNNCGAVMKFGRECRFYLPPSENYKWEDFEDIRKYCLQDYARMESLNRGDWQFIGVIAKAVVRNPETGTTQTIRSGGLWGVESDSGDYLEEIGHEQLEELRGELSALGIGPRAINYAFKTVKTP